MAITLEDLRQQRMELLQAWRAVYWSLADLEADAVRQFGRGVIGTLAGDEQVGRQVITTRIRMGLAFPAPRLPDVTVPYYRQCLAAADRLTKQLPQDDPEGPVAVYPAGLLRRALEEGLRLADVKALHRAPKPAKACKHCGTHCPKEGHTHGP